MRALLALDDAEQPVALPELRVLVVEKTPATADVNTRQELRRAALRLNTVLPGRRLVVEASAL